ncbi:hypothetical protein CLCR_06138 [Cladophialophora carrionii]|uniref:Uncharacterized protein n=1 Tax=Cladophialophora carrionii TaxID=86049 RepID=A0A1C1C741_9EURO|nr:hypothetical protein CLCR_06138 [Cladophialophora carrionii]
MFTRISGIRGGGASNGEAAGGTSRIADGRWPPDWTVGTIWEARTTFDGATDATPSTHERFSEPIPMPTTGFTTTEEESGWTGGDDAYPIMPPSDTSSSQVEEFAVPSSSTEPFQKGLPEYSVWESNSDASNSLIYNPASFLTSPESVYTSEGRSGWSRESITPYSTPTECQRSRLSPSTPIQAEQLHADTRQVAQPIWQYCSWVDPITNQRCRHREVLLVHLKQHEMAKHNLWRCRMPIPDYDEPCFLAFGQSSDLRAHQRAAHPDQFICKVIDPKTNKPCGTKFADLFRLGEHLRAFHDSEPNMG